MRYVVLFLIILGNSSLLLAQPKVNTQIYLDKELLDLSERSKKLEKEIKGDEEFISKTNQEIKLNISEAERLHQQLVEDEKQQKELPERLKELSDFSERQVKGMDPASRLISRKSKFYKCVKEQIETSKNVIVEECLKLHPANLTDKEKETLDHLSPMVKKTGQQLEDEVFQIKRKIAGNEIALNNLQIKIVTRERTLKAEKDLLKEVDFKLKDYKFLKSQPSFLACDSTTPEIDLEAPVIYKDSSINGPFYNVPRDNQDGLGTCYANTAKNLLVGLSGGKDISSFLDLALLYKNKNGQRNESDLDGGVSCEVLNEAREKGYCPQQFSPAETGLYNPAYGSLLASDTNSFGQQVSTLTTLKDFFQAKNDLAKSLDPISTGIIADSKNIIEEFKNNTSVKIPLPEMILPFPKYKVEEMFFHSLDKKQYVINEASFMKEYDQNEKKFEKFLMNSIINGKTGENVNAGYLEIMTPFFNKYGLQAKFLEAFPSFKPGSETWSSPDLKNDLVNSLRFLKKITHHESSSDNEFLIGCLDSILPSFEYLNEIKNLANYIKYHNIETDKLFKEDGKARDSYEVLQLAIAPNCLNPNNRKKIDTDFICGEEGFSEEGEEKNLAVRTKLLSNLLQGKPVGNTFDYTSAFSSGRHINTIVGMRYNAETGNCEYKIRESQTGESNWHEENIIAKKMLTLTSVRTQ